MQSAYNFTRGLFSQPKVEPNAVRFLKFQNSLLLIATSRSIQVWSIATGLYKCIFNKPIPDVCLLELFNDTIAYITFEQKTQINFYSLDLNRTRHVHMTPSPVRKILSSNQEVAILLLDSTIQVLDEEFSLRTQFKTFEVNIELFPDNAEIEAKSDLILCQFGFPIDFSIQKGFIAYSYTMINKQPTVDSIMKQFNSTALSQNFYIKEAASKIANIGNQAVEGVNNLIRI